jgi:hypothetical protein
LLAVPVELAYHRLLEVAVVAPVVTLLLAVLEELLQELIQQH